MGLPPHKAYGDIFNILNDSPTTSRSKFIQDRITEIKIARDLAFKGQERYFFTEDQQWEKQHISKLREHKFVPGEYVLVKRIAKTGANVDKLSKLPAMIGPAIIKKLIGKKAVLIQYLVNGQVRIRNYKHLVHFHAPENPTMEQKTDQKYFNSPGDRTNRDERRHPILELLDNNVRVEIVSRN